MFGEVLAHFFIDTVIFFGGVPRHMIGPQNGCLFTFIEELRIEVFIRADFNGLFV